MKKKHIDAVQYMLNGGPPSASNRYTDAFVEHILTVVRDKILEEQLQRKKVIPEELYQTVCISFNKAPFHECNCSSEDTCAVLKSVLPIPNVYDINNIVVMNMQGEPIDGYTNDINNYRLKYSLLKPNGNSILSEPNTAWYYQNGYIYIMNNPFVDKLLIKFIPSEELSNLEVCDTQSTMCAYGENKSAFIPTKWAERVYKVAVDMIVNKRQDKLNDAVDGLASNETSGR